MSSRRYSNSDIKEKLSSPNRDTCGLALCPLLHPSLNITNNFILKYDFNHSATIIDHIFIKKKTAKMIQNKCSSGIYPDSLKIAKWIVKQPSAVSFMGSVGKDEYTKILEDKCKTAGVTVKYQYQEKEPTGTCAVVVTKAGTCRSLVANLAAANLFTKSHIEIPENHALIEKAKFYYISGFFLTVSPETIVEVGKHACEKNKVFTMNLSAPFIVEFFKDPMMQAFPYIDILFGNETEAAKFGEVHNFGTSDLKEIAVKAAALPKQNKERSRTVIITQGADTVILCKDGKISEFTVTQLPAEKLIDTNGAGDAFVGGFLAQLIKGEEMDVCIKCGIWAATHIIQRSGCTMDPDVKYKE
ncbi:unnamed protein product, partial [Meganyctiphanes norvegica]